MAKYAKINEKYKATNAALVAIDPKTVRCARWLVLLITLMSTMKETTMWSLHNDSLVPRLNPLHMPPHLPKDILTAQYCGM